MNEEAQAELEIILKKDKVRLTLQDIGFLQARREYLSKRDAEEYSEYLTDEAIKETQDKLRAEHAKLNEVYVEPEAPKKVKEEEPKEEKKKK